MYKSVAKNCTIVRPQQKIQHSQVTKIIRKKDTLINATFTKLMERRRH